MYKPLYYPRPFLPVFIFILFACTSSVNNNQQLNDAGINSGTKDSKIHVEVIAQDLDVPWGMDFLPDGTLIFNERNGNIKVLDMKTRQVHKITERNIASKAEGGLLGLAVDPDFNKTHYIFIYETVESGNRIVRLVLKNDIVTEDKILIDKIPHEKYHDGGVLRFGPDGYLYAGTGDARNPANAQDLKTYAGKILRMDKDGNAVKDNPFNNLIYSYGNRNVQGLAWDDKGNFFSTEHGPSGELNGWCCHDELNEIIKGNNYGWPFVIGDAVKENTALPLANSGDNTWAPGGLVYVKGSACNELNGKLISACLRGEKLIVFNVNGNTAVIDKVLFDGEYKRLRNIIQAPDGSLIFCSSNKDGRAILPVKNDDKIYRMRME